VPVITTARRPAGDRRDRAARAARAVCLGAWSGTVRVCRVGWRVVVVAAGAGDAWAASVVGAPALAWRVRAWRRAQTPDTTTDPDSTVPPGTGTAPGTPGQLAAVAVPAAGVRGGGGARVRT
jgi:hypothetical protein